MSCTKNGVKGWKYGASGKCYTGKGGKAKARAQARAMHAAGYKEKGEGNKTVVETSDGRILEVYYP